MVRVALETVPVITTDMYHVLAVDVVSVPITNVVGVVPTLVPSPDVGAVLEGNTAVAGVEL